MPECKCKTINSVSTTGRELAVFPEGKRALCSVGWRAVCLAFPSERRLHPIHLWHFAWWQQFMHSFSSPYTWGGGCVWIFVSIRIDEAVLHRHMCSANCTLCGFCCWRAGISRPQHWSRHALKMWYLRTSLTAAHYSLCQCEFVR